MAGLASVGDGPLGRLQCRVHPHVVVLNPCQRVVGDVEGEVVACGLEHRQRLLDERGQPLSRRALRLDVEADGVRLDPPAELGDTIARRRGSLGEGFRAPERVVAVACPEQGVDRE